VNEVLAGVRVLDLTNALAASSATKILADLGAEVIKIENPAGGDYTRALMPYIFESHNRNKRSFAVDLKHPEGSHWSSRSPRRAMSSSSRCVRVPRGRSA